MQIADPYHKNMLPCKLSQNIKVHRSQPILTVHRKFNKEKICKTKVTQKCQLITYTLYH